MFGLVEFFGGPAWTAAVVLGTILAILAGIRITPRRNNREYAFFITLTVTLYFLCVLGLRGLFQQLF